MFKKKQQPNPLVKKIIVRDRPLSPISEQYKDVRTNIEYSMVDETVKTIVCTSALPGDGKSTTVSNLAVAFAQQEKSVLLVDADLRKPTLWKKFEIKNVKGLTNLLVEKLSVGDIAKQTSVENLWVLPAGIIPPNPAELLGSNAMKEFIKQASSHFDIILFDTPPLLSVADARILACHCDGVIITVRSGVTKKEQLVATKDLLDQAKIKIIGSVLNGVKNSKDRFNYYGGK